MSRELSWSLPIVASPFSVARAFTSDDVGNVLSVVAFTGRIRIGNAKFESKRGRALVKVAVDDGSIVWARDLSALGRIHSISADGTDVLLTAVVPSAGLSFANSQMQPTAVSDIAVLALDSNTGADSWSQILEPERLSHVETVSPTKTLVSSMDEDGTEIVYVEQAVNGRVGDALATQVRATDLEISTATRFGNALIVAGSWQGTINKSGARSGRSTGPTALIASLNADGSTNWMVAASESTSSTSSQIAANRDDVFWLGQFFGKRIRVGGFTATSAGVADIFLARLDGSTGEVRELLRMGGREIDRVTGVATSSRGLFVGGAATSDFSIGTSPIRALADGGMFVVEIGRDERVHWVKRFGRQDHGGYRVLLEPARPAGVIVSATYVGRVQLDASTVLQSSLSNTFIARYDPPVDCDRSAARPSDR
jgi:hypothetical protein